ncbi:MAG: succinate dehydrogenase, hydrophobic membrane anchor protein [Wenzhouxiangellaceae bacterium]|nr:succinate dehydrogenase, hydrophobic membrane anchor protein [Wenzhouxiangellaceae bacterium]
MKSLRHPIARARNLGSAGSGVEHWWSQRFSSILLVPLVAWLVWALLALPGADYAAAHEWLARPWNAGMAILFVGASFYHARLGLQVIIEDYVHHRATEVAMQVLVAIAALVGALISILAVLRVALVG